MSKSYFVFTLIFLALIQFCKAEKNHLTLQNKISASDYPLDNGFILRGGIGFTGSNYGWPENQEENYDDILPSISVGLELGSQWYVWRHIDEIMGLAINVNWLDGQYAAKSKDDIGSVTVNIALLEFGPLYTVALNDDIGLDAFFNLRPTILGSALVSENPNTDERSTLLAGGFGLSFAVGLNFRWKVLLVGAEYGFGKIKATSISTSGVFNNENIEDNYKDEKLNTNLFKINLGVKL